MSEKMPTFMPSPEEIKKIEEEHLLEAQKDESLIRQVEIENLTDEQNAQSKEREYTFNAGVKHGKETMSYKEVLERDSRQKYQDKLKNIKL